jgi:hypothetical protein
LSAAVNPELPANLTLGEIKPFRSHLAIWRNSARDSSSFVVEARIRQWFAYPTYCSHLADLEFCMTNYKPEAGLGIYHGGKREPVFKFTLKGSLSRGTNTTRGSFIPLTMIG